MLMAGKQFQGIMEKKEKKQIKVETVLDDKNNAKNLIKLNVLENILSN